MPVRYRGEISNPSIQRSLPAVITSRVEECSDVTFL